MKIVYDSLVKKLHFKDHLEDRPTSSSEDNIKTSKNI